MDIITNAPTPGTAQPGNLYADLQSRTLWLGVDAAVDQNQAVLISDIVALQAQIVTGDNASRDYTKTSLLGNSGLTTLDPNGYSGRVHTHQSNQITDFTAAVTQVASAIPTLQFVRGQIILWYGQPAAVGVDKLAGWALCDGTTYTIDGVSVKTPNLMDRFVIGASPSRLVNSLNPLSSFKVDQQGAHSHGSLTGGRAITAQQLPAHAHTFSDSGTFNTGNDTPDHAHGTPSGGHFVTWSPSSGTGIGTTYAGGQPLYIVGGVTAGANARHHHGVTISVSGNTGNGPGTGAAHDHTIGQDGAHQHTVTSTDLRDTLSSYALCYIMKL